MPNKHSTSSANKIQTNNINTAEGEKGQGDGGARNEAGFKASEAPRSLLQIYIPILVPLPAILNLRSTSLGKEPGTYSALGY